MHAPSFFFARQAQRARRYRVVGVRAGGKPARGPLAHQKRARIVPKNWRGAPANIDCRSPEIGLAPIALIYS